MATIAERIEKAKSEISALSDEVDSTIKSKANGTLSPPANAGTVRTNVKARRTLKGHFGKIMALHWSGDSKRVVSAAQDGNLLVWNAVTANKIQSVSLQSSYVMSVGMEQSSGNLVACGGLDNLCTVYRLGDLNAATAEGPSRPHVELAMHDGFISCCRFQSESKIITSSGDSTCLLWDLGSSSAGGKVVQTFAEHSADVMFVALKPDDSHNVFASVSVDKTCKIWDVRTDRSVQTFAHHHVSDINSVDFMPSDSNVLATCSDDETVRILDMRSYNVVQTLGKPNADPDHEGYKSVACSRSGRLVFAGHASGSLVAYDVLTGKAAYQFASAHAGPISCMGVPPSGSALCTGSWDKMLKVYA